MTTRRTGFLSSLPLLLACLVDPVGAAEPAAPVLVSLPASTIQDAGEINLYGVVLAQDARKSIALLGSNDGPAFPFRPGDELAPSWRLVAVQRSTAIIASPSGAWIQLVMQSEDLDGRRQAAARLPPIRLTLPPEPAPMPSDEKLEQARREFNLPASD